MGINISIIIQICEHMEKITKGGRGKKPKHCGHARGVTKGALVAYVKEIAPKVFIPVKRGITT